jgi:chemotaxis protein methyltransferase CheR
MTFSDDSRDVERFRAVIVHRLGLRFEEAKSAFLSAVLHGRLETLKIPCDSYLERLETEPVIADIGPLARELTVGETYFFRNNEQFQALAEVALPDHMRARARDKTLRILSAGCASGEEAYSIAIIRRETIPDPAWKVTIRAVDLNAESLRKAARARYSAWALRESSAELQRKWFRPEGREMALDETIRAAVGFEQRNLAVDDPELWRPGLYDVIFCRNVLMYFSRDQARAALERMAGSLAPGGYLFLGHAETLRGLSEAFHLRHTHGTFYYQLKDHADHRAPPPEPVFARVDPAAPATTFTDAWVDAIREASERVEALIPVSVAPATTSARAGPTWDMTRALELLRHERFGEALAYVRNMPRGDRRDPDALLLEAMLLAHGGEIDTATAVCQNLLAIDDLNAGAHYVLALCRESAGDRADAAEHDRVAAYLDATFAMPRLHLGLLARRVGDREGGRRELEQALMLLRSEDPSRILLFGGGFNREALIVLCGSALRDCGGQP